MRDDSISKASVCEILADIYPTDGERVVPLERINKAYESILSLSSAQPDIIRCKDCKHWRSNTEFCSTFTELNVAHRMPPNGFCSCAEKREE